MPTANTGAARAAAFAYRTIDGRLREDETQTLSLHNRAFTLASISPRISLTCEELNANANAQALDHDRSRAELSFVRHP